MSDLKAFLAMLGRAGIGHGQRYDHNPEGTGVQVEHECEDDKGWFVSDWQFDADGKLVSVSHYPGEES